MLSYSTLFDECYISDESYQKTFLLDECTTTLNEGISDKRIVNIANTNTYSMVIEFLENVKATLLKLCSMVLSYLNNYILNSAKLIDKYREILRTKLKELKEPFTFSYYKYPESKHYPTVISSESWVESEINKLQNAIKKEGWHSDRVENAVNRLIVEFADRTIGEEIDPYNVKEEVTGVVTRHIRGDIDIRILTADELDKMIDEFKTYKPYMDEIKRTKSDVEKDYQLLKKTYTKAVKIDPETKNISNLEMIYDPELAGFKANEQRRFGDIKVQMTRLFTAFINIYNKAFDTKLSLIQERIDLNRHIIQELLQRTGVFAALNTKDPDRYKKPYKYEPIIKT